MVNYFFNEESQILETTFKGNIYLTEILDYAIETRERKDFPKKLRILTDAQQASFKFSMGEFDALIEETERSLDHFDTIINAMIIDSSETGALSALYHALANTKRYHFEVFSSREAALIWLSSF